MTGSDLHGFRIMGHDDHISYIYGGKQILTPKV